MIISCDLVKRDQTLRDRGVDMLRAGEVFTGPHPTRLDDRLAYGETRYVTAGWLDSRLVVFVWTPRGAAKCVISMRHCHEREAKEIRAQLAEAG